MVNVDVGEIVEVGNDRETQLLLVPSGLSIALRLPGIIIDLGIWLRSCEVNPV